MIIDSFRGEYRFLSNFYPSPIIIGNVTVLTVEHGYQGMKTKNMELRHEIFMAKTPGEAKKLGQLVELRDDWEDIKIPVMRYMLNKKFEIPHLKESLLATGNAELIEGNTWGDVFWGVCNGKGKIMLGRLLMAIREELRIWE